MEHSSKTKSNITLYEDIIFLNKNKEYGAYALRKSYNRNLVIGFAAAIILFVLGISSMMLFKSWSPYNMQVSENDKWIILIMKPDGSISAYDSVRTDIKEITVPGTRKVKPVIRKSKPAKIKQINVLTPANMYRWKLSVADHCNNNKNMETVFEKQHLWVENSHSNPAIQRTICSVITANIVN